MDEKVSKAVLRRELGILELSLKSRSHGRCRLDVFFGSRVYVMTNDSVRNRQINRRIGEWHMWAVVTRASADREGKGVAAVPERGDW